MRANALPYGAFASCALIWGSTFLVIRLGNDTLPALWACGLRLAMAALVLNAIIVLTGQGWPKGEALKAAVWFGFWEFGVSLPMLYWGEKVVPSGIAAVLYAICPVVAMFEARVMGLEQLSASRLGAAALAFLGVAVIFWRQLLQGGSGLGLVAVFLAAATAPIAALMLQRGPQQSAIGANAVGSLVALPLCLAASFAIGERHELPSTAAQLLPVAYLAIASSAGAFVLFAWLVRRWKATTVSFLGVIVPVIAVILGWLVRHEQFSQWAIAGASIVLVGVTVALKSEAAASMQTAAASA